jgi:GT2 family glycosyltransferase
MFEASFVILSFNHPDLTRKCVSSVLEHEFSHENVFLIHNGSTQENQQTLMNLFPTIQHVVLEANRGFSGGMNAGLARAFSNPQCKQVMALTNDTVLRTWPKIFNMSPGVSLKDAFLLAPLIERRSTGEVDSLGGYVDILTGTLSHFQTRGNTTTANANSDSSFYVPGTAFLMSKAYWLKVGPFEESLGTYWEDVELSLRGHKKGAVF